MITLTNVEPQGSEARLSGIGFTPDAFPEAKSSKTGVSVRYVESSDKQWYVFRASYGRVDKASDFLIDSGTYTYVAKKYVERYVRGRKKKFLQPLIPNIIFAYTSEAKADEYVSNTPELSYLSYYFNHFELDEYNRNPPLIVPIWEMRRFVQLTSNKNKHLLFIKPSQCHYKSGELVKVIDGPFEGVEGMVARVSGQQRVVVSITNLGLVSTAYVPTAFLKKIE